MLLTITERGYGKLTPFEDYSVHGRGGKGIVCHAITEKTGLLAGVANVGMNEDVMLITDEGTMIRTPVSDIRVCGRASQGVIVMRLADGARIVNFAPVRDDEEAEAEAAKAAAEVEDDSALLADETDSADSDENVLAGDSASDEITLLPLDDESDADDDI